MTEAMEAEFDTVAEWTARVAVDLGPDHYVPAGCRGSGSPAALDWLIEHMGVTADHLLLDSGAGVGGPAAYAAQSRSARPFLVEPEAGACRAAKRLFDFPVVRAAGGRLPLADSSFDAGWSLGVLCTTDEQLALLAELRRTVRSSGRIGLLTFVARRALPSDHPEGNNFPTTEELRELLDRSSLHVEQWLGTSELPSIPRDWTERMDTVTKTLSERYGHTEAWQLAERQSSKMGRLLDDGTLTGELLVLRHC